MDVYGFRPGRSPLVPTHHFAGAAGGVAATLDYRREPVTVKAKNVSLGTFTEGPQPVLVAVKLGADGRADVVRTVRKGKSLRY